MSLVRHDHSLKRENKPIMKLVCSAIKDKHVWLKLQCLSLFNHEVGVAPHMMQNVLLSLLDSRHLNILEKPKQLQYSENEPSVCKKI